MLWVVPLVLWCGTYLNTPQSGGWEVCILQVASRDTRQPDKPSPWASWSEIRCEQLIHSHFSQGFASKNQSCDWLWNWFLRARVRCLRDQFLLVGKPMEPPVRGNSLWEFCRRCFPFLVFSSMAFCSFLAFWMTFRANFRQKEFRPFLSLKLWWAHQSFSLVF